jgi:aspartate/methionine/tyrosine aminotransferase
MAQAAGLSTRGVANVDKILPQISASAEERANPASPRIDMATAENCLIRDEIISITKAGIQEKLDRVHLAYPDGFAGDMGLIRALVGFLNSYFSPHIPVEESHISIAPGAATCLNTFLYNVCDPGEGILVPAPYWNSFDWLFTARSSAVPIPVFVDNPDDTLSEALIPALEEAFSNATIPVRALILSNPHNPYGQSYPRRVLEGCVKFCHSKGIHYISDEVFALSTFDCPDLESSNAAAFTSVLSLDMNTLGCDLSRVHAFWGTSKTFGSNGFRVGCSISQGSRAMQVGLALASHTETSSLSAIATMTLLSSLTLPSLIATNRARHRQAYMRLTSFLRSRAIEYLPAYAGPFLFARIAPKARSWEDEAAAVERLKEAGVNVSGGKSYHVTEQQMGWARLTFAIEPHQLETAMRRMASVFPADPDAPPFSFEGEAA